MNNTEQRFPLHLITALDCEARPLVTKYQLKRCVDDNAFAVFRNDNMTLTVSGVGKLAAANAVGYTQGRYHSGQSGNWLNIGIAGHPDLEIGECRLAHKILDPETNTSWYPALLPDHINTSELVCVNRAETEYIRDSMYDMESAGFVSAATRYQSQELIHSMKIISDNHSNPVHRFDKKTVTGLITDQIDTIDGLINILDNHRQHIRMHSHEISETFTQAWHFSKHQYTQLNQLLNAWYCRSPETLPEPDNLKQLTHSKQVIAWLKEHVAQLPVRFD